MLASSILDELSSANEPNPSILFVGNSGSFRNDLLRLVRSDFEDFRVTRHGSFGELARSEEDLGSVAALVLDETYADQLAQGYDAIREIVPNAQVALAYRNQELAIRFLKAFGERCFVEKVCLLPMRVQYGTWRAIMSLLVSGEGYLPSDVVNAALRPAGGTDRRELAGRPDAVAEDAGFGLTEREVQVLHLVSTGKQNKSVAAELGLSEHTVKLHMHHIITKLGARNRTEATVLYLSRTAAEGRRPAADLETARET